jgi:hypothetical protein
LNCLNLKGFKMADLKISQLTAATTPLAGTEVVPLVQSGVTKQVAVSNLTAGRAVSMGSATLSDGTANGFTYLNGSKVLTSGSALTFDGSNFGIGTSSPTARLDVQGPAVTNAATTVANLYLPVSSGGSATYNQLQFDMRNGSAARVAYGAISTLLVTNTTGAHSGALVFSTASSGTVAERMRLDASGNLGIGTTANASAILDAQSTTKGVRMPNMTTTQKNAIASPAAGLMVFDTTLAKLCVYTGAAWQTITSI